MTRIIRGQTAPTAKTAPKAPVAPANRSTAPAAPTMRGLTDQAVSLHQRLGQAVASGQWGAARKLLSELRPVVSGMRQLASNNPARLAIVERVDTAVRQVEKQLASAPRPAAPPAPAPAPAEKKGPLAFLGTAAQKLGSGLEKVGRVAFFPLEALGKVLDPVREGIGNKLSSLKNAIDNSVVGKLPVIGQATRFTTGLAASLVGMVDGAVQAVTHPVDLIKGLGSIAGTVVGLVPGPRQLWDYAVHGTDPVTSYKAALGDAKNLATALIQPSLDDFEAGNYAGGIGRLVGDIGSLVVTGGAAGGAKGAQLGVTASRAGKLANAVKAGARVIGAVDNFSAKIVSTGLKANFAPLTKAGKVLGEVAPLRTLATKADDAARVGQAAPAAVATKAKAAYAFAEDALQGEVRMANAPDVAKAIADQPGVIGKLGGAPVWEHLSDQVLGAFVDTEAKLVGAFKELKLNGRPVSSLEEAAEAWKALPENSAQRAAVGKKLAAAVQESFAEGLKFPPAAVEFTALPEHLAGLQTHAKVLLDPSLLNEDLRYLVNVMAEEQTHAYQRFLADNKDALKLEPKMAAEVDKYAREFQVENYLNPPAAALEVLAKGIDAMRKPLADLTDHADENLALTLRRQVAPRLAANTPERAVLDTWWAKASPESERLSFLKFALGDLEKMGKSDAGMRIWANDYAGRIPDAITHLDGVPRKLDDARSALTKAIKESQESLLSAHNEVTDTFRSWTDAYKNQSLEFTAKHVASDVARWMFGE